MEPNGRILLVDDDEAFVQTLARRLRNSGFHVTTALSGLQALEILSQEEYEVIVLDVLMPDLGGLETLRLIKQNPGHSEVIMLTGHGSVKAGVQAIRLGAFDYLIKPCTLDDLLERIGRAQECRQLGKDH